MKSSRIKGIVIVLLAMAMVGFTAMAFAQKGTGMQGRHGAGHGAMGFEGLTEEQTQKAEEERGNFLKATEDIRQQMNVKELELQLELAKKDVNIEKAKAIQKELSSLEAQFDQKRLEHRIEMQKISPNLGRGMGKGMGMKGGRGGCCKMMMESCPRFQGGQDQE